MTDLAAAKAAARSAARARRDPAHRAALDAPARELLRRSLEPYAGRAVAGYLPIGSEIDPRPVMAALVEAGPVCVPVIRGKGRPLGFRAWHPEVELVPGPFGVPVPAEGTEVTPEVLIVPLLAFDRRGYRLGYGGGFYDRTLARLREGRATVAIGFAYAAQEVEAVPAGPEDVRLDALVTDAEVLRFPA